MIRSCSGCGRAFDAAGPEVTRCPDCGGPPEAGGDRATLLEGGPGMSTLLESELVLPRAEGQETFLEETRGAAPRLGAGPDYAAAEVPLLWPPGALIADTYEVLGELGAGGMGTVYRVRHVGWGVDLAVKTPKPAILAGPGGVESFTAEAETWVDLGLHPHTVSCYYVRSLGGVPRVFAEYVAGGSLADWIADGRLYAGGPQAALERILDIAVQFAWGLAYAHQRGLIHQDVKPANLMLTTEGVAKVTDFGLARAKGRAASAAPAGAAAGESLLATLGGYTLAYASPEQLGGAPDTRLTRRTDLYSFAVSLLHVFNGGCDWKAGSLAPAVLGRLLDGPPAPHLPALPEALVEPLAICLAEDPERRLQNMETLAALLLALYAELTGAPYPRPLPKAAELLAPSLNNRALSYLDLGRPEEALAALQEASERDPFHPEAAYNFAMLAWERGAITDAQAVRQVEVAAEHHAQQWLPWYYLGLAHERRKDAEAALRSFQRSEQLGAPAHVGVARSRTEQAAGSWPALEWELPSCGSPVVATGFLGDIAAAAERSGLVRLWELGARRSAGEIQLQTRVGEHLLLASAGFSPRANLFVGATSHDWLQAWHVLPTSTAATFKIRQGFVPHLALSDDGRLALTAGQDGSLRLWRLADESCVQTMQVEARSAKTDSRLVAVDLDLEAGLAVSGGPDERVRLWDLDDGSCRAVLEGHEGDVTAVSLSPDGQRVVSGSSDLSVRLWDVESGRCLRTLVGHGGPLSAVAFTHAGDFLVSGATDRCLRVWDAAAGVCLRTFEGHAANVRALSVAADDGHVLSGDTDGGVRLWGLRGLTPLPAASPMIAGIERTEELAAAASELDMAVAVAERCMEGGEWPAATEAVRQARAIAGHAQDPQLLRLWQRIGEHGTRVELAGFWPRAVLTDHTEVVFSVALSRDGRRLVSGSADGTLRLWDPDQARCLHTQTPHGGRNVVAVALSRDARCAASGGADGVVRLWRLDEMEDKGGSRLHRSDGVYSLCFSPSGEALASGGADGCLWISDLLGAPPSRLWRTARALYCVAYTPDGSRLLCASADKRIHVVDARRGRHLGKLAGHQGIVFAVAVSSDGLTAVSGGQDNALRVWDLRSQRCSATLLGHQSHVLSVAITPDGRFALSGSWDNEIRVWDLGSGECAAVLRGHEGRVQAVCLSADGHSLASGSWDDTVRVWELDWDYSFRGAP
jgi:WD40 repeat protein/serine/threonine protein kinase